MTGQKIRNLTLGMLVAGLLLLPALGLFRTPDQRMAEEEKRTLTPAPERPGSLAAWRLFPEAFNKYFNDHFFWRRQIIAGRNSVKLHLLGVSANKEVVIGKKGWLFFDANQQLADYRGLRPMTDGELEKFIATMESRVRLLAPAKIPYLLVLVPEKHFIYPEYLPTRYRQMETTTRFDQIVNGLRFSGRIPFLDLRPALLAAKSTANLYYPSDSHWNPRGAFAAYRRVMEEVKRWLPAVPVLSPDEVTFKHDPTKPLDLARLLALSSPSREELPLAVIHPAQSFRDQRFAPLLLSLNDQTRPPWHQPFAASNPNGVGKILFFGDSFSEAMTPYFSETFREGIYFHWPVSAEIIQAVWDQGFRPELVIEELVVRNL